MVPLLTILYVCIHARDRIRKCAPGGCVRDAATGTKRSLAKKQCQVGKRIINKLDVPLTVPRIISLAVLESDLGFELTAMDAYERRTKGVKKSRIGFHLDDALCLRYFRETWA